MQQLNLMYNWCNKLKTVFTQITQMYEKYQQKKDASFGFIKNRDKSKKQQKNEYFQNINIDKIGLTQQQKNKALKLSPLPPPPSIKSDRESYSYKQRIAALRRLGKKAAEEQIDKQENEERIKSKQKNKMTAFFLFARQKRGSIKEEYPELGNREVAKILSDVWKTMSEVEKKAYENQNKSNKVEFDRKFKKYLDAILKLHNKKSKQSAQSQDQ